MSNFSLEIKPAFITWPSFFRFCIEWLRNYYIWMDGPFEHLNADTMESLVKNFRNEFERTQKYYRNKIKQDMLGNPILKFRGQTEDPDPDKHPVPLRLCDRMINWIDSFRTGVYIVKIMCNSALRDRHWIEMSELVGFNLKPDAGSSLRKIINWNIDHLLPNFEIISIGANKELQLKNDLNIMINEWKSIEFPIDYYKETKIKIIKNIDDVQVLLDDHIIKTLAMRGSTFVKPCEKEVRSWYDQLTQITQTFEQWTRAQLKWLYYLPILSSTEIRIQMPIETQLFDEINDIIRKYMDVSTFY